MARNDKMIAALLRERAGYAARGAEDRVRQVDEQLRHHGHEPAEDAVTDAGGGPKGRTSEPAENADASTGSGEKRRRGRPRLPRDADGNIIRD